MQEAKTRLNLGWAGAVMHPWRSVNAPFSLGQEKEKFSPILIKDEKNEVTNLAVLQAPNFPGCQLFVLPWGGIPAINPPMGTDAPKSLLGLKT